MSQRTTLLIVSALCLLLALSLFASAALAECPRYPPAPGYIDGIGYQPAPGSPVCHYTGWRTSNPNAPPVEFRCHPFDPSANPFGDATGSIFNAAAFKARYGIDRPNCPSCNFGVDAETILGAGSVYLQKQCCADAFRTATTHTCFPTLNELFDYGAAHAATAWVQSGVGGSGSSGLLCGNGRKDREETCATCPQDLGPCEGPAPPINLPTAVCGNSVVETGETCATCLQDFPVGACVNTPPPGPVEPPVPCPAGQACLPIVPECSRCPAPPCPERPCPPAPPMPSIAELLAAAPECSRWRAVVESAEATARNGFTRQHRRQLVSDCVKGLDREIQKVIQP